MHDDKTAGTHCARCVPFFAFSILVLGASFSDEQILVRRWNKNCNILPQTNPTSILNIGVLFYYFDLTESSYTAPFLCLSKGSFLLVSSSGKEKHIKQQKISFQIKTHIRISKCVATNLLSLKLIFKLSLFHNVFTFAVTLLQKHHKWYLNGNVLNLNFINKCILTWKIECPIMLLALLFNILFPYWSALLTILLT